MVVLVCGSRSFGDGSLVCSVLSSFSGVSLVVHGGCRGADRLASVAARALGLPVRVFSAAWSRFGRGAGPIRNRQMLDVAKPDLVLAFRSPGPAGSSPGTADMVSAALSSGVPVRVFCGGFCSFASGAVGVSPPAVRQLSFL